MLRHQFAVFAEGTRSHHHLELTVRPDAPLADLRAALRRVRLTGEDHRANGGVNMVLGFGPALWSRLVGGPGPDGFVAFGGYGRPGSGAEAPATQRDLWVWAHGPSTDVVFDVADQVVGALAEVADVALDQPAFVYRDSRDLTGFIDGTANPFLDHAPEVALVPDGEPGAGGTFALTMRWVHDLAAFHARPLAEQEQVFGRTKSDSIELDAHTKPADAHIARVEIEATDGEELELYRRSAAFGTPTEKGLVFVAFAADLGRCDLMLRRMFGEGDDGLVDRLLTFSTPTTGSFWFCPSLDDLERSVGELPDGPD